MLYEDIQLGGVYQFERTILAEDVQAFAALSGDTNPLHMDPACGAQSVFGKNIVHGLLIGSLFSKLVGVYCPGDTSLYVSQTAQFKAPIFVGDTVLVRGEVTQKHDSLQMIRLKTEALVEGKVKVTGEAVVKVL